MQYTNDRSLLNIGVLYNNIQKLTCICEGVMYHITVMRDA